MTKYTVKKISPYEKMKRQKERTKQKLKNEVWITYWIFSNHFQERKQERAPNMTDKKLSKDFCWAITGKRVKRCIIGNVFKVYGNKFRYILWGNFELITLYPVDKKKESNSNEKHKRLDIWNTYRNKMKTHFKI